MSRRAVNESVVNAGDYVDSMSEKQLQEAIIEAAQLLSYRFYHTYDSRRSVVGFPDLILLRERDGRRFAIECKTQKGKASEAQMAWLATFSACGIPALIVRPNDLDTLLKTLR